MNVDLESSWDLKLKVNFVIVSYTSKRCNTVGEKYLRKDVCDFREPH